ncbi:MAG: DUF177 domain-containing protein [Alphaproteobacteria bacterium]|nr:DUF177 domain-containing protein [Alphaproteobacteria bacterium]
MSRKKKSPIPAPEWSVLFAVEELTGEPVRLVIEPDAEAVKSLLKRLDVKALEGVKGVFTINRSKGAVAVNVQGAVEANVTQSCVVTLEPIKSKVREEFEAWFTDPEQAVVLAKIRRDRAPAKGRGEKPLMDEQDDPEPIIEGKIDLGELATQYISLAVDPYPRAPGVELPTEVKGIAVVQEGVPETRRNPFAALKDWKDRLK